MIRPVVFASIALLLLDAAYLYLQKDAFRKQVETVQKGALKVNLWSVVLCYLFILFGLYFFIWREHRTPMDAAILGAVIYGVYDTTTMALFKDWSMSLAIVDVVWGAALFATSTAVFRFFER